jgi:acetyl esterase/lipase
MQDLVRTLLKWSIRLLLKPVFSGWMPFAVQRAWLRVMTTSSLAPHGTHASRVDMNGLPALRLAVGTPGPGILLFLHGGGYCIGSTATHRALAAQLARAAAATCYAPDYRLAPEHPYPAALDDALKAWRWLLAQGHSPARIAIAGDSAGGGLALATTLALRDAGQPLPAALLLISPWTDLSLSGDTGRTHAWRDPMLSRAIGALWARSYLGRQPADHPLCSPLFASLSGLPPMLIQVGTEEILLDDSRRLGQRAAGAGVAVQLQEYPGMWHDFQTHAGLLQEADAAMAEAGRFLRPRLEASTATA